MNIDQMALYTIRKLWYDSVKICLNLFFLPDIKNSTNSNGQRFFSVNGDASSVYGNFMVHQVKNGAYYDVC
jgi:hypothetical protein